MIVITAPTGNIGKPLLEQLFKSGERLRVIVRNAKKLPEHIRENVEVVEGSHGDSAIVEKAFASAESVFWLVPPNPTAEKLEEAYLGFSRPACDAIRAQGVKRVVAVSALGRGLPIATNAGLVTASLAMDDAIAATGVDFRALALPSFMDNMLRQADSLREQGKFYGTIDGDLKAPTCSTGDIAGVAAKLLVDRSWKGQGDAPVLGPQDISANDMATTLSEVLGKPVQYQQVSLDDYKSMMSKFGMSEAFAQGMIDMMAAKNAGLDNAVPRTPESTTPTTFREWCQNFLKPAVVK